MDRVACMGAIASPKDTPYVLQIGASIHGHVLAADSSGRLRQLNIERFQSVRSGIGQSLAFSAAQDVAVCQSALEGQMACAWDTRRGCGVLEASSSNNASVSFSLKRLPGAPQAPVEFAVSSNGIFVAASRGGVIVFYDVRNGGAPLTVHEVHGGQEVTAMQFVGESMMLLSAGEDDTLALTSGQHHILEEEMGVQEDDGLLFAHYLSQTLLKITEVQPGRFACLSVNHGMYIFDIRSDNQDTYAGTVLDALGGLRQHLPPSCAGLVDILGTSNILCTSYEGQCSVETNILGAQSVDQPVVHGLPLSPHSDAIRCCALISNDVFVTGGEDGVVGVWGESSHQAGGAARRQTRVVNKV